MFTEMPIEHREARSPCHLLWRSLIVWQSACVRTSAKILGISWHFDLDTTNKIMISVQIFPQQIPDSRRFFGRFRRGKVSLTLRTMATWLLMTGDGVSKTPRHVRVTSPTSRHGEWTISTLQALGPHVFTLQGAGVDLSWDQVLQLWSALTYCITFQELSRFCISFHCVSWCFHVFFCGEMRHIERHDNHEIQQPAKELDLLRCLGHDVTLMSGSSSKTSFFVVPLWHVSFPSSC